MRYAINIRYCTGNSFGSEDTEQHVELEWDNLEIAKDNLQRIRAHYKMYTEIQNGRRETENILEDYKHEPWFVSKLVCIDKHGHTVPDDHSTTVSTRLDIMQAEYYIRLVADNGNTMMMSCFWCGYFEQLYGAEIVGQDSDLKFEI